MQPSIFGKKLDDVEFSDVVDFCAAQPKEGLGLDYKKDLSSLTKVVKSLVSFANTNGGWIIVGVEDEDDAPKLPVVGMPFSDDFEQKVTNSIVSTITPIVLPFYRVCKSVNGKRAFLIIHMPQSPTAPHMMQYKGKNMLFVRIADRSASDDWENTASNAQWEMLYNRRKASVELRDQLATEMKDIYEARYDDETEAMEEKELEASSNNSFMSYAISPIRPFFEGERYEKSQIISILPAYPTNKVTDVADLKHQLQYETVSNMINKIRTQTPDHRGYDTKVYQNGAYSFHHEDRIKGCYFYGLDAYGNMINIDKLELSITREDDQGKSIQTDFISADSLIMSLVGTLRFAEKVYSNLGLLGNVIFRVEFDGTRNVLLYPEMTGLEFNTHDLPQNVLGRYLVQEEIDTNVIYSHEARTQFVLKVVTEIMSAFNVYSFDKTKLTEFIDKVDRYGSS